MIFNTFKDKQLINASTWLGLRTEYPSYAPITPLQITQVFVSRFHIIYFSLLCAIGSQSQTTRKMFMIFCNLFQCGYSLFCITEILLIFIIFSVVSMFYESILRQSICFTCQEKKYIAVPPLFDIWLLLFKNRDKNKSFRVLTDCCKLKYTIREMKFSLQEIKIGFFLYFCFRHDAS